MLWSGIIVGLFIIFHLADLTWGTINTNFERGNAYNNQISSFKNPLNTGIYLLAIATLTSHLFLWSLTQSLGTSMTQITESARRHSRRNRNRPRIRVHADRSPRGRSRLQ